MSTPCAIFAKNTLFSAETYRKTHFSVGYSNFFALFAADITKFMYHYNYRTWKWTTWTMQATRFIYTDKAKGVKCILFSPQYIEHKISKSNDIPIRMNEQKNILERLAEVIHPFKTGLNAIVLPNFSLLEAYCHLINVKYVKNEVFENYFEQFSHFSTV